MDITRKVSNEQLEATLANWKHNGELDKLKFAFKLTQMYEKCNKQISNADLLERVANKFGI